MERRVGPADEGDEDDVDKETEGVEVAGVGGDEVEWEVG